MELILLNVNKIFTKRKIKIIDIWGMIKANELRIGNILTSKQWKGEHEVDAIELLQTGFKIKVKGHWHEYKAGNYFDLEAICVSKEVLLKFGFNKKNDFIFTIEIDNGWYLNWESNYIFLNYKENECEVSHRKIEYIHQLQNIYFELTGKELNTKGLI